MKINLNDSNIFKKVMLLFTVLISTVLYSQTYPVQVTPQLIPPYSLKMSDYATTTSEKLYTNILLTDVNEVGRRIRLKMYIEGQGLSITTQDVIAGETPIYLDGGINLRLSNLDLQAYFQLNNLVGITPGQYNAPLPNGGYDFCFEVYDYFTNRKLSSKSCTTVYLLQNDPPILNLPFKDNIVNATNPQNVLFTWTPRHSNASNVQYEFTLKELWDVQNPQANFLASVPFYQTTTYSTTLLVGSEAPQLLSGKIYGWQVRAFASDGINETSVFKNDGKSEIFWFKYLEDCQPPSFVISQALTAESVQINWQSSEHLRYRIQYRKKGFGDDDWFEVNSYTNEGKIRNLEPATVYEFRVGGECTQLSGFAYSNIQEFTTPSNDEAAYYNCGLMPQINITNKEPLPKLGLNETFTAGDFPVTTREVSGSNGTFSGWGYITLPFLENLKEMIDAANIATGGEVNIGKYTRIKVVFDNVQVNSSYELIEGVVETDYDPEWGGIIDTDEIIDDIGGDRGNIENFDATNTDIKDVKVDEKGNVVIIPEVGDAIPIETGKPVTITDKNGDQWTVHEDGKVTEGKAAEGGAPSADNTEGISNAGNVKQISSKDVRVTFTPSGYYGTDTYQDHIKSDKYKSEYKFIKTHDNEDYSVLYKLLSDLPEHKTDIIKATVNFSNGKTKDDIVFKTKEGSKIEAKWSSNSEATLELQRKFEFAKEEILATVKPKDSAGKFTVAGKLNVWHAQQQTINLTLVSVDGASVSNVGDRINEIYNKAGIHFNIKTDSINLSLGNLDVGDSDMLSNYTEGEKSIISTFKNGRTIAKNQYYMFFLDKEKITLSKDLDGFMPLKRQFGFVFTKQDPGRVAAHELGHGIFGLKHPFDQYDAESAKNENHYLMSYGIGIAFSHMDWQKLHAPGIQLYWFQGDETGESISATLEAKLSINGKNKFFGFLTPNGSRIILPKSKIPIFYHGIENNKYNNVVPGVLIGFKEKDPISKKWVQHWAQFDGDNFLGYRDFKYEKPNVSDDNSLLIGLPFGKNDKANYAIYKFKTSIEDYSNEPAKLVSITSEKFKNLGFFTANNKPIKEATSYRSGVKLLGENQIGITTFELEILKGKYLNWDQFDGVTTLIHGVTNISHDEHPEVFLITKIAEYHNRYPVLFKEYTTWFDTWNNLIRYKQGELVLPESVLKKLIQLLYDPAKGTWELENVTSDGISNPNSNLNKWINNISKHNSELYDFYRAFVTDMQKKIKEGADENIECLKDLSNKTGDEIYDCVIKASEDELKRSDVLSFEDRIKAIKSILENIYVDNENERAIVRLIKHFPSSFDSDAFIDRLITDCNTSINIKGKDGTTVEQITTCFWELLFESVDNSKLFASGDNRKELMLALLKHYYRSDKFKNELKDYNNKIENFNIESHVITFTYDYQSIYRRMWTQVKENYTLGFYESSTDYYSKIDTKVINKDIGDKPSRIEAEQITQKGFLWSTTKFKKEFNPFGLVNFVNKSNQDLLSDFSIKNKEGKHKVIPVPSIMLHYASEVGNNKTTGDVIQTTIDLATLVIPGGQLSNVGKFIFYADKISSVSSIAGNAFSQEDPKYKELSNLFNKVSLATGVLSFGDLVLSKKITQIGRNTNVVKQTTQNILENSEAVVDEVLKLNKEGKLIELKDAPRDLVAASIEFDRNALSKMGHLEGSKLAKYDEALHLLRKVANTIEELEDVIIKSRKFTKEDVKGFENLFEGNTDLYKEALQLFVQDKFDNLFELFSVNDINNWNGVIWPPLNGFRNIEEVKSAKSYAGESFSFDRFQDPSKPSLGGSYASPVEKIAKEAGESNELFFTYDSRMLSDKLTVGTYYFKFNLSDKVSETVNITTGEVAPWFKTPASIAGKQVKASVPFHTMELNSFENISIQQLAPDKTWRKCIVEGKGVVTELQEVVNKLPKELADDLVDYINSSKDVLKLFKEIDPTKLDELIESFRLYRKHNIEIPTCK